MKNSDQYGFVAKVLHWFTALLVIALLILGKVMTGEGLALDVKFSLYQLHKSIGITVLFLTIFRLVWRLTHPVPPLPHHLKQWEKLLARSTHIGFYCLLIIIPLSGWVRVSTATFSIPTLLYGFIPWPHIGPLEALSLETKKNLEPAVIGTHYYLGMIAAGLILLHIAGALKHHIFDRDDILARMWFGAKKRLTSILITVCFLITFTGLPTQALAASWNLLDDKSQITFDTTANKQKVEGKFTRFSGKIEFDPEEPEKMNISFEVDTSSATIGNAQVDQGLRAETWFDVSAFPNARFQSEKVKKTAEERYGMTGTLTIKDKALPVAFPFEMVIEEGRANALGGFSINRSDFGIGLNIPPALVRVDEQVIVRFSIWAEQEN